MTTTKTERGEIATLLNFSIFTVSKESKTLIAEASDIPSGFLKQAYNDSADRGFRINNNKTGKTGLFTFLKEDRDGEGEITGWIFTPTAQSVTANPTLAGWTVLIIND